MRPDMDFAAASRLAAQNAGAWLMILFGGLFVVMNAMQGSVDFVAMNLAFVSAGALSLWLAAAGFQRTALTLLSVGSCVVFFAGALAFKNGMENYLLVTMAASLLLLDQPVTRILLAGVNAAAFFYVKLMLVEAGGEGGLSAYRYGTNILLFLLALGGIIEFFRVLNSDYLKGLEAKNRELSASNTAKERLFSIVAHDLRGPVGNLKTSVELLETGALSKEDFRLMVRDLSSDIEKAHVCVENLLSWSATQLGGIQVKLEPVRLLDAVEESCKVCLLSAKGKRITITREVPEQARVMADSAKLQVVIRNLLSNAVKFTQAGGSIAVSAREDGAAWTISVSDTGRGMDQARATALFAAKGNAVSTPGTEQEKGLGLGTEICREFVALMGGTIGAESVPDRGTTVRVTFKSA
jgi:signal transduction histidine kinase